MFPPFLIGLRGTAPRALALSFASALVLACSSDSGSSDLVDAAGDGGGTGSAEDNDASTTADTGDMSDASSTDDTGEMSDAGDMSDVGDMPDVGDMSDSGDMSDTTGEDTDESDSGGTADAADDTGGTLPDLTLPVSTASALCGLSESGQQQLVYTLGGPGGGGAVDELLDFAFDWACDATNRTLTGNGVPNHATPNGSFATRVSAQNVNVDFPIAPAHTGENTVTRESGYALNGVKFDPATAGTCADDATSDRNCNYAMGTDAWNMVATPGDTSPWRFTFGVDDSDAHVQPSGAYHYHGIPVLLVENLNPDHATSMTLIGWAMDGYPMYSVEGYSDPLDSSSAVVDVASSYRTLADPLPNRPSTTDFPMGHFEQDWEYVAGSGDLDECNGRFGVTPEFPEGIYHYYVTRTYPFVQRCVKGTADVRGGGPGGGGPPGG